MQGKASTLHLRPEAETAYTKYHQAVWPEVLQRITECNIRNYSILLRDGILFIYFEYDGEDYALDMAKMAADQNARVVGHHESDANAPEKPRGRRVVGFYAGVPSLESIATANPSKVQFTSTQV